MSRGLTVLAEDRTGPFAQSLNIGPMVFDVVRGTDGKNRQIAWTCRIDKNDDKCPLPNRNTLFASLSKDAIFPKFDLKVGFWQIGIRPKDRPNMTFYILGHHYQWKILPFGLKTAPSMFQKAMTKIYGPILSNALVYIDDILLFSPIVKAYQDLLSQFIKITQAHGIMLSERKMKVGLEDI